MSKSIYIITPRSANPGYNNAEVFEHSGLAPSVFIAELAVTTIAAMVPEDFHVELCESNVVPINFDHPAEFIGITGKNAQFKNMIFIAQEFRKRGKTVIIGGPFASLNPDAVRPYCDILVEGEMEDIAEDFFNDLRDGTWKDYYKGTHPDLKNSPIPRWDLYPNEYASIGAVQTSRGCPFECEFCDAIQYLGRKQRSKDPEQVIAELNVLYNHGYRSIFLSDDNFTAYRRRAKEMLQALKTWNQDRTAGHVTFFTQLSIDAAQDEELLTLCTEAGLWNAFVGIETPNEESLKETNKVQNLASAGGGSLAEKIDRFVEFGISVTGGMIVGFDNDDKDIFEIQFRFAMETPVPVYTVMPLVAPMATPLFNRLEKAGRIIEWDEMGENSGTPWITNVEPILMTHDELIAGTKWLVNNLYAPENYGKRLLKLIELHGSTLDHIPYKESKSSRTLNRIAILDSAKIVRQFARLGPEEAVLWQKIVIALKEKPWLSVIVMGSLTQYMQIRYMYSQGNFWNPKLVNTKPELDLIAS